MLKNYYIIIPHSFQHYVENYVEQKLIYGENRIACAEILHSDAVEKTEILLNLC